MRTFNHRLLRITTALLACSLICVFGCDNKSSLPIASANGQSYAPESIKFLEHVESNRKDDGTVTNLSFVDTNGKVVRLEDYEGAKNVLLVFTRGFSGMICPYCTSQTSRLIANYEEFRKRDTEILLVYPGQKGQLSEFQKASTALAGKDAFPFPVLLDEDLAAVNQLGIAAHLAFPSTFLIDKQGNVRLSYVGSTPSDRPSIQALLEQIDAI